MDGEEIHDGAAAIWEKVEAFSESMLGEGPMGIFKLARDIEPTKTMLAREKVFAVDLIAEYIASVLTADSKMRLQSIQCRKCRNYDVCTRPELSMAMHHCSAFEPANADGKADGVELIRRERERQKNVEGWTPGHDDQHARGELASAAVCYAMIPDPESAAGIELPGEWPESWSESWWKPSPDNRVRELEKAGALIAAEIDRLMRAAEVKRRLEAAHG